MGPNRIVAVIRPLAVALALLLPGAPTALAGGASALPATLSGAAFEMWHLHSPYAEGAVTDDLKILNQLTVGADQTQGNNKQLDLQGTERIFLGKGAFFNMTTAAGAYSESGNVVTPTAVVARNYLVDNASEYHFDKTFFVYLDLQWYANTFVGVNDATGAEAGAGVFLIDTPDRVVRTHVGYSYEKRNLNPIIVEAETTLTDETIDAVVAGGRYFQAINAASYLLLDALYFHDTADGQNYRASGSVSLTFALTTTLALTTQAQVNYDNVPVAGYEKTDTSLATSLTITF
jgi:putative salt-induced outer membrane protein YdiY